MEYPLADQTFGSLLCLQRPAADLHPDPHKSSPHPATLLNIHFNILFPFMHSCMCLSFLIISSCVLYVPPIFSVVCTNDAGGREQVMRHIIMYVSQTCAVSPHCLRIQRSPGFTSRPVSMKSVVDKLALALVWGKIWVLFFPVSNHAVKCSVCFLPGLVQ